MTNGQNFSDMIFDLACVFAKELLLEMESSQIVLTSLGVLLVSKPAYFIGPVAMEIMKSIFSSSNLNLHYELLSIFCTFLEKQANKQDDSKGDKATTKPKADLLDKKDKKGIDMKVLVGNAESFSEDGIPTSLLQSFLDEILEDVLSVEPLISATAFRVMSLALENGLIHPVKVCLSLILAER